MGPVQEDFRQEIKMKGTHTELAWAVRDNGCWEVTSHLPGKNGYVELRRKNKRLYAHREVYKKAFGPIPKGMFVCHKCDNKLCVNPAHLEIGTNEKNLHDMWDRGLGPMGSRNGHAKLTEMDVVNLRESDLPGNFLAKLFGVSQATISEARNGRLWKHVGGAA
jgi:hypothetical protein